MFTIKNRIPFSDVTNTPTGTPTGKAYKKNTTAILAGSVVKAAAKGRTVASSLTAKNSSQEYQLAGERKVAHKHTVTPVFYHIIFGDNALAAIDLMRCQSGDMPVASMISLLGFLSNELKAQLVTHMVENLGKKSCILMLQLLEGDKFLTYAEKKSLCSSDSARFQGGIYIELKESHDFYQSRTMPSSVSKSFIHAEQVLALYRMIKVGETIDLAVLRRWLMENPSKHIKPMLVKAMLSDSSFDFSSEPQDIKNKLIDVVCQQQDKDPMQDKAATGRVTLQLSIKSLWEHYYEQLGAGKGHEALLKSDVLSCKLSGLDTTLLPFSHVLGEVISTLRTYVLESDKGADIGAKSPSKVALYNLLDPSRVNIVLSHKGFEAGPLDSSPSSVSEVSPSLYAVARGVEGYESPELQIVNGAESSDKYFMLLNPAVTHLDITSVERPNLGKHITFFSSMRPNMTNSGPHLTATYIITRVSEKADTAKAHDFNCGKAIESWLFGGSQCPGAIKFITHNRLRLGSCTIEDLELQNYIDFITVSSIGLSPLEELCVKLRFVCDGFVFWQLDMMLSMLNTSAHIHAACIVEMIYVLKCRMERVFQTASRSLAHAEAQAPGVTVSYLEYTPTPTPEAGEIVYPGAGLGL